MNGKSVVSLMIGGVLLAGAARAESLNLGDRAPATAGKMKSAAGPEVSIADVKGTKGTLVIFSCNACPWVKKWETRLAEIGNAYPTKGIGVIVINANDPTKVAEDSYPVMQQRAKERGFQFPYVVDATSDVARVFGASHTPEAFLFDASGQLVYRGAIDDNASDPAKVEEHFLRDALNAVLAGKDVAVKETKALGCTIKFRPKT
jgi:peroxiredoxin